MGGGGFRQAHESKWTCCTTTTTQHSLSTHESKWTCLHYNKQDILCQHLVLALKQDHRRKDKKLKQVVGVKEHLHRLLSR